MFAEVSEDLRALSPTFFEEVEELKFKYVEAEKAKALLARRLFDATSGRAGIPAFSALDDLDVTDGLHDFGTSARQPWSATEALHSELVDGVPSLFSARVSASQQHMLQRLGSFQF